jgi:ectoine hydroxylase-related dioxygenase (phytanoyl-CoA dioxygenase family)
VKHPGDAGYALHEAVIPAAEIQALLAQIDALSIPRSRAGARHVLDCPPVSMVARDARLLSIASEWLDAPALPFKATLFDKNPASNWLVAWHQDTALPMVAQVSRQGWGPWSNKDGIQYAHAPADALRHVVALRLHLDDSDADNGPLRVLPGTHDLGVLTDAQVHEYARCIEPRVCCVRAGGVVAMRPLIIHASSKSRHSNPRRVLHIEYAASLEVAPGMRLHAA